MVVAFGCWFVVGVLLGWGVLLLDFCGWFVDCCLGCLVDGCLVCFGFGIVVNRFGWLLIGGMYTDVICYYDLLRVVLLFVILGWWCFCFVDVCWVGFGGDFWVGWV